MEDAGARPRASPQVGAPLFKVTYVEVQLHPETEHPQVSTEVFFQDNLGATENWREEKWLTQKGKVLFSMRSVHEGQTEVICAVNSKT